MKRREFLKGAAVAPLALPLMKPQEPLPDDNGVEYPDGPWAEGWEKRCGCDNAIYSHLWIKEYHTYRENCPHSTFKLKWLPIPGTLTASVIMKGKVVGLAVPEQGPLEFSNGYRGPLYSAFFDYQNNMLRVYWKEPSPTHSIRVEYEYSCAGWDSSKNADNPKNLPVVKFEGRTIQNLTELFHGVGSLPGYNKKKRIWAWVDEKDYIHDIQKDFWGEVEITWYEIHDQRFCSNSIYIHPTPESFINQLYPNRNATYAWVEDKKC
jgi:hypothetical protein